VWNVNPKTTPISPEGIFKPGKNKYPLAPGYPGANILAISPHATVRKGEIFNEERKS
jgi:hypothetical protein